MIWLETGPTGTPSGFGDLGTWAAGRGGGELSCTPGGADEGGGGFAAGLAGCGRFAGVREHDTGEGLVGEEAGFGGDEFFAGSGHGADGFETLGCPGGLGPGEQVGEGDLGVLADFEEGHGAIEEEGEEEGVVGL